jgi:hypothetical protein
LRLMKQAAALKETRVRFYKTIFLSTTGYEILNVQVYFG